MIVDGCDVWSPCVVVNIASELGVDSIWFSPHSPQSFEHTFFGCKFLDLHLTTYHSNVGVQIIGMLDNLGTSTMLASSRG